MTLEPDRIGGVRAAVNRSGLVLGHRAEFYRWLRETAVEEVVIESRKEIADEVVYLIPTCLYPEEFEEVIEDLFEEIFTRELTYWQPIHALWPDTGDFDLFSRWFTVKGFVLVDDLGTGPVQDESAGAA